MTDLVPDEVLMNRNLEAIARDRVLAFRVSAEHYAWLAKDRIEARRESDARVRELQGVVDRLLAFVCAEQDRADALEARLGGAEVVIDLYESARGYHRKGNGT